MLLPKNITIVNEENFEKEVLQSDLPVILALGAPWCIDCKRAAPFYMALAKDYDGIMKFATADSDQNPKLKESLGIQHIPTMIVFKAGKEMPERLVEVKTPSELKAFVEKGLEFSKQ